MHGTGANELSPVDGQYATTGQATGAVSPELGQMVPVAQDWQAEALPWPVRALHFPGGHKVGADMFDASQYPPTGHGTQSVVPMKGEYVGGGHGSGMSRPGVGHALPNGHGRHHPFPGAD